MKSCIMNSFTRCSAARPSAVSSFASDSFTVMIAHAAFARPWAVKPSTRSSPALVSIAKSSSSSYLSAANAHKMLTSSCTLSSSTLHRTVRATAAKSFSSEC
eukprot:gnl/TRDRNA2_/TRDRNA2_138424_c2_seq4.p1 gnl/TRDRNA2_/TRDRNA2_138424_c2~~gnl/TRDRNA2_/TRDRNA2_138424_c2_seq4.p1  ORF type:complete len:102 (-),score=9.32 gnl/TRDRNA2_/TRDRNA2_138424_c2_seq4:315-620(-)